MKMPADQRFAAYSDSPGHDTREATKRVQDGIERAPLTLDSACKYWRFEQMPLDLEKRMAMVGATVG
ncbi:MAG: hypothetical protein FJW24_10505 [Acidimicrobiia bacterium]|nr:hypothetical protein [Acidimicrobiia bacterium]